MATAPGANIRVIQKNKSFYFSSGQPLILFLNVKEEFLPSFKKIEKNLEGATRGQSFVWEVNGIFWANLATPSFGKLAVNSQCGFFTIGVFVCFKNNSERKIEIPLTDFETASII